MTEVEVVEVDYKGQRIKVCSDGTIIGGRGKPLKQRLNEDGYFIVTVGRYPRTAIAVHRLVADSFIGYKPEGFQVNHIDGDKTNNNADNLEHISQQDNLRHAFVTGLRDTNMPAKAIQAINKEGFGYWFFSQGQAATYGFTQANVSQAIRGVRPTCKGFSWSFV